MKNRPDMRNEYMTLWIHAWTSPEFLQIGPVASIVYIRLLSMAQSQRHPGVAYAAHLEMATVGLPDSKSLIKSLVDVGLLRATPDPNRFLLPENKLWHKPSNPFFVPAKEDEVRKARMKAIGGAVRPSVRAAVFARDNWMCVLCGSANTLTIDHIQPVAKGGDNSPSNLQTLCLSCNCAKKDRVQP